MHQKHLSKSSTSSPLWGSPGLWLARVLVFWQSVLWYSVVTQLLDESLQLSPCSQVLVCLVPVEEGYCCRRRVSRFRLVPRQAAGLTQGAPFIGFKGFLDPSAGAQITQGWVSWRCHNCQCRIYWRPLVALGTYRSCRVRNDLKVLGNMMLANAIIFRPKWIWLVRTLLSSLLRPRCQAEMTSKNCDNILQMFWHRLGLGSDIIITCEFAHMDGLFRVRMVLWSWSNWKLVLNWGSVGGVLCMFIPRV